MSQTQLKTKPVAQIGEEIGLELGNQMVKAFAVANPNDVQSYIIGRNIIDQILAQPGCVGIKFYCAINEKGEKTFVYVGLDLNGKAILQFSAVNNVGTLQIEKGIVADRIGTGTGTGTKPNGRPSIAADDFEWEID